MSGSPGGPEAPGAKSEFRKDVGPQQEYNIHMELARVHETQLSHEAAAVEYQKAVDVCQRNGSLLKGSKLGAKDQALAERRMAAAFDRLGRFAQAETHYNKALKLSSGDAKVWNDAGYSYYLQNRLSDAERSLKTANSLDPNDRRVLTNLGLTLAAEGKTDEALAVLTRAAGPAVGHANLGFILAAMGHTEQARTHYESALTLQPEMVAARQALAKLDAQAAMSPGATVASSTRPAAPLPPIPSPAQAAAPMGPASPTGAPSGRAVSSSAPDRPATARDAQLTRTTAMNPAQAPRVFTPSTKLPALPPPLPASTFGATSAAAPSGG
jgi:Flp pilus assembly protein TadD